MSIQSAIDESGEWRGVRPLRRVGQRTRLNGTLAVGAGVLVMGARLDRSGGVLVMGARLGSGGVPTGFVEGEAPLQV